MHPFFTYLKAGIVILLKKLRSKAGHSQKQRTCIKNQGNFLTQNIPRSWKFLQALISQSVT